MAIDTGAKRFSMMNFVTRPWTVLFPPDGAVGTGDRVHMLFLYAGITIGAPVADTPGVVTFTVPGLNPVYTIPLDGPSWELVSGSLKAQFVVPGEKPTFTIPTDG